MKKHLVIVLVILGAVLLFFSVLYAKTARQKEMKKEQTEMMMNRPGMKMREELNLTDEQKNSIRDIEYDFQKAVIGMRAELKTSRLELRHQMMQDKPDQQQISNLVDKIGETQKQLLKQEIDRKLAMKAVLTPEQFQKFQQMREDRMGGRMEGRMMRRMKGRMGERMEGGWDSPDDRVPPSGCCPFHEDSGI